MKIYFNLHWNRSSGIFLCVCSCKIFPPAAGVALEMPAAEALKPFQTGDQIVKAITVTDFPELISRKNMLPLLSSQ